MKTRLKKLIPMLVMFCFFLAIYPQQEAQARFWGKTTTEREGTQADGGCYTQECTETCRFWICNTNCVDRPGC